MKSAKKIAEGHTEPACTERSRSVEVRPKDRRMWPTLSLPALSEVEVSKEPALSLSKGRMWNNHVATLLFVGLTLLLLPQFVGAQCSMCRAVTESNQHSNDAFTIGNGLNNAIVYLMFMPYIFGAIFIWAFYGKQIRGWFKKSLKG